MSKESANKKSELRKTMPLRNGGTLTI
jgi:hypothetical protein